MRSYCCYLLALTFVIFFSACSSDDGATEKFLLETEIIPADGGSVSPSEASFNANEEVLITASPSKGYVFKEWQGVISGNENPAQLRMTADKKVKAVFEKGETVLAAAILGKWDIDSQNTNAPISVRKTQQTGAQCQVFSVIFNSDGTFILNHSGGIFKGFYSVESKNSLVLQEIGRIYEILISESSIEFRISLTGLCTVEARGNSDKEHQEGECTSFVQCQQGTVWKAETENEINFLVFGDPSEEKWLEKIKIDLAQTCKSVSDNTAPEFLLTTNNNSGMVHLEAEKNGQLRLMEYKLQEDNSLLLSSTLDEITENMTFSLSSVEEMQSFSTYGICPSRTFIPDDAFEKRLIEMGVDDLVDNYVLTEKIAAVQHLNLGPIEGQVFQKVKDMTGIEDFENLNDLVISGNEIAELDLRPNIKLTSLRADNAGLSLLQLPQSGLLQNIYVPENNLTALDISGNPELKSLVVSYNQLAMIDVSGNVKMQSLQLQNNAITSIDVRDNKELWSFRINENQLTEIDLSNNTKIHELGISGNLLTALDVTAIPGLWILNANDNQLSSIDLTQNPGLELLYLAHNKLTEVDLTANQKLVELYLDNNLFTSLILKDLPILAEVGLFENQLSHLSFENLPNLYSLIANDNLLKNLDLSVLPNLDYLILANNKLSSLNISHKAVHSLDARGNSLTCIQVVTSQLGGSSDYWRYDEGVVLSTSCN